MSIEKKIEELKRKKDRLENELKKLNTLKSMKDVPVSEKLQLLNLKGERIPSNIKFITITTSEKQDMRINALKSDEEFIEDIRDCNEYYIDSLTIIDLEKKKMYECSKRKRKNIAEIFNCNEK
jgi:hypothetical protein